MPDNYIVNISEPSNFLHDKLLTSKNINLIGFSLIIGCVLAARFAFFPNETTDYTVYLSKWVEHLVAYGFNFEETFSNYNFPYLYLLWFGTLFTHDPLVIVKIIGVFSDLLLGLAVYKIVYFYAGRKFLAGVSFLSLLILPEVLINSSLWGQSDSLFTSFVLFGLFFFTKNKPYLGWLFVGLALSFKIQTVFVLPALIVWFIWKRHPFKVLLPAIGVFAALLVPAVIAGRSFNELLYAYTSQIGVNYGTVSVNIPNVAVFFGSMHFAGIKSVMICISLALTVLVMLLLVRTKNYFVDDKYALLKISSLFALLLPFVLPNMLDRYYFVGSMLVFVLSFVNYRYIILMLTMQVITIITYTIYLSESVLSDGNVMLPVVGLPVLVIGVMIIITTVFWFTFKDIIREKISI